MILFLLILGATYTTLFLHGSWHGHRHTKAIERGLGRKLKRAAGSDLLHPRSLLNAPLASVFILTKDFDWMTEAAVDEIDSEGGCTEEEWAAVEAEIESYKRSLV